MSLIPQNRLLKISVNLMEFNLFLGTRPLFVNTGLEDCVKKETCANFFTSTTCPKCPFASSLQNMVGFIFFGMISYTQAHHQGSAVTPTVSIAILRLRIL